MKQARKILMFFVFLALAIYYVPLMIKYFPGQITKIGKSTQMANFTVLVNKQAEKVFYFKK